MIHEAPEQLQSYKDESPHSLDKILDTYSDRSQKFYLLSINFYLLLWTGI